MSTTESRAKLVKATKKLMVEWQQVAETWRDENCRQFDKKYMSPLESYVRAAQMAMERMGAMLNAAQHECKDSSTGSDL